MAQRAGIQVDIQAGTQGRSGASARLAGLRMRFECFKISVDTDGGMGAFIKWAKAELGLNA